jgi:hypothetical protein
MRIAVCFLLVSFLLIPISGYGSDDGLELIRALQGVTISGEYFLSYKYQDDKDISKFQVRRAYLTFKKEISPLLSSRITFDTYQDGEGDGIGDMEVRLKFIYVNFKLPDYSFLSSQNIEFGIVRTPAMPFEQSINRYRMRDLLFLTRSKIMNPADFGVMYTSNLFGELTEKQKKLVGKGYAGRYGSIALGIYNGGGFHAQEANTNKVIQSRLSIRPLPYIVPGMQISFLNIYGKGNSLPDSTDIEWSPDWKMNSVIFSFQHRYFNLTNQYVVGEGNQDGNMFDGRIARNYTGNSLFLEVNLSQKWHLISGYDTFDGDSDNRSGSNRKYSNSFAGIGYDFGNRNMLLFDINSNDYESENNSDEMWYQLTMRVKF